MATDNHELRNYSAAVRKRNQSCLAKTHPLCNDSRLNNFCTRLEKVLLAINFCTGLKRALLAIFEKDTESKLNPRSIETTIIYRNRLRRLNQTASKERHKKECHTSQCHKHNNCIKVTSTSRLFARHNSRHCNNSESLKLCFQLLCSNFRNLCP